MRTEEDRPGVFDRFVNLMLKTFSGKEYRDWYALEDVLRNSSNEWTTLRAPRIVEGEGQEIAAGYVRYERLKDEIGTRELAEFLVGVADEGGYVRQTPYVVRTK